MTPPLTTPARWWALVFHPQPAWQAIAAERWTAGRMLVRQLLPVTAIAPLAWHAGIAWRAGWPADPVEREVLLQFLALSPLIVWAAAIASVVVIAAVFDLMAPVFDGRRAFPRSLAVAAYALTPAWLACVVLAAPLARYPLLTTILLIGFLHSCYLFYVGVQHLLQVPEKSAAECAAITLGVAAFVSTVLGYCAGAAGLFPGA